MPDHRGTLSSLCGPPGGIPDSSYVCTPFAGTLVAWEWVWAPFGNETGLCDGAAKAKPLQPVILQSCGAPLAGTDLWVPDHARGIGSAECLTGGYCPWYNAGGTAAVPVVLKVKAKSRRSADPRQGRRQQDRGAAQAVLPGPGFLHPGLLIRRHGTTDHTKVAVPATPAVSVAVTVTV